MAHKRSKINASGAVTNLHKALASPLATTNIVSGFIKAVKSIVRAAIVCTGRRKYRQAACNSEGVLLRAHSLCIAYDPTRTYTHKSIRLDTHFNELSLLGIVRVILDSWYCRTMWVFSSASLATQFFGHNMSTTKAGYHTVCPSGKGSIHSGICIRK